MLYNQLVVHHHQIYAISQLPIAFLCLIHLYEVIDNRMNTVLMQGDNYTYEKGRGEVSYLNHEEGRRLNEGHRRNL